MEALWYTIIILHKKFTDLFLNESDKSQYKISDQKCYFFMLLQTENRVIGLFCLFFRQNATVNFSSKTVIVWSHFCTFLGQEGTSERTPRVCLKSWKILRPVKRFKPLSLICSSDGFPNILTLRIYENECCHLHSK